MTIRHFINYIISKGKNKLQGLKGGLAPFFKYMNIVFSAALLIVLLEVFGGKGLYGWLVITLVFAFWRLIKMWSFFMSILRYIETMIWGRPLDKKYWDKGEFKKSKRTTKLVWKKKESDTDGRN